MENTNTELPGIDLPELPAAWGTMYSDSLQERDGFTADQMRGYALDAITQQAEAPQADQWKRFVDKAVDVLQRAIVPDGLSDSAAMAELYGIFDGPEFRDMGGIPQLQCDGRQEQAAREARQLEMLKSIGTPQAPAAQAVDAPSDEEIINALWDATGRDWKPNPLPGRTVSTGYFYDYGQLIDAFRTLLPRASPASAPCAAQAPVVREVPDGWSEKAEELVRDLYNFEKGRHFAGRLERIISASTATVTAPAQAADYTVDDSELARKIMVFMGRHTTQSMEPGADPLRDRLAERLASWRPVAAPAAQQAAPTGTLGYALFRNGKQEGIERSWEMAKRWVNAEIVPLIAAPATTGMVEDAKDEGN